MVKYQFHQGFWLDQRSKNPNHPLPPVNNHHHRHRSVLPKGRSFTANSDTKAAVLPKGRSFTTNSGTMVAGLLGLNSCGRFPLLSAPYFLFSIWTDLKRSEKIPGAPAWRWGLWIWLTGPSRLHWNISSMRIFDQIRDPEIPNTLRPPVNNHHHHHHQSVLPKGRSFTVNSGTKAAALPKGRSSTANSGTMVAVLLGMNKCGSFPLLSVPHSLFSIWTDLKRSEKIPGGFNVEVRRVDLANWALWISLKFTTGIKYKFHQVFLSDQRSRNPNHPSPLFIVGG